RASESIFEDVRRLLVRAVDTAYYQIQLATEQIRIAKADEEFSRKQYEETRKLQQAGRATQADVDNFRVRVFDAQTSLAIVTNAQRTGKVVLAELLGIEGAMLPEFVSVSSLKGESDDEMAPPEVRRWLALGLSNRPDIARTEFELDRARRNLQAAQGLYLPTVAVSGSWGYDRISNMRYRNDDQSAVGGLEFRWDLFAGGVRGARVNIARHLIADVEAQLRKTKLTVESEIRQAINDLVDSQQRILLQRESLEIARENRRIVEAGYIAGKETLNRLNEAQRDFVTAQASLAQARINMRQAWTDLHAAAASQQLSTEAGDRDMTPEDEGATDQTEPQNTEEP
ncbi:MAG: TolC family protein, partial [Phycisphaerae bacterium]